jgi:A/G-specific adenine glycosylase
MMLSAASLTRRLLAWYDRHRRRLPWRALPGATPDPYRVWLSEVMLQQTTVATVGPYFQRFIERWPDVRALAAAPLDDVLHAWQGLGYYARARNLHRCAQVVVREHDGRFPDTEESLRVLPGVGAYTAAAIAAIAFGRKATPVDGNVQRVIARLYAIEAPLPAARASIEARARALTPNRRAGDFAQALMDLGSLVCTPRAPMCALCPWRDACVARRTDTPEGFPRKGARNAKPIRYGIAFWILDDAGAVLLRRRVDQGLLGGMMEIPSTPWRERPWTLKEACPHAPTRAAWRLLPGNVDHTFSHFHLDLAVAVGRVRAGAGTEGIWCPIGRLADFALPTAMKKIVRHALDGRAGAAGAASSGRKRRGRRTARRASRGPSGT